MTVEVRMYDRLFLDACAGLISVDTEIGAKLSWFNHHRLLEPIGYIPPAEAEENYYRQLVSQTATVE